MNWSLFFNIFQLLLGEKCNRVIIDEINDDFPHNLLELLVDLLGARIYLTGIAKGTVFNNIYSAYLMVSYGIYVRMGQQHQH